MSGTTSACFRFVLPGFLGLALFAQQPPSAPPAPTMDAIKGGSDKVCGHPFPIGSLVLSLRKVVLNFAVFEVRNPSAQVQGFDPADLAIADASGSQLRFVECSTAVASGWSSKKDEWASCQQPAPIRLLPGLRTERTYLVTDTWKAPYRIYFQGRLLAEVTD